MKKSHF